MIRNWPLHAYMLGTRILVAHISTEEMSSSVLQRIKFDHERALTAQFSSHGPNRSQSLAQLTRDEYYYTYPVQSIPSAAAVNSVNISILYIAIGNTCNSLSMKSQFSPWPALLTSSTHNSYCQVEVASNIAGCATDMAVQRINAKLDLVVVLWALIVTEESLGEKSCYSVYTTVESQLLTPPLGWL